MKKIVYQEPQVAYLTLSDEVMDTITVSPGKVIEVIDDGEDLGVGEASIWDDVEKITTTPSLFEQD